MTRGFWELIYNWTVHNWKANIPSLHEVFGYSILRRNIYFGAKPSLFVSVSLNLDIGGSLCTTCDEAYSKNTIWDRGSTALFAAYTVDTVYAIDNVYAVDNVDIICTVDMVYTVDMIYTGDMAFTVDTTDTVYTV